MCIGFGLENLQERNRLEDADIWEDDVMDLKRFRIDGVKWFRLALDMWQWRDLWIS
jgi:hypothetical protein